MSAHILQRQLSAVHRSRVRYILSLSVFFLGTGTGYFLVNQLFVLPSRTISVQPVSQETYQVSPEAFAKDRSEFAEVAKKIQMRQVTALQK